MEKNYDFRKRLLEVHKSGRRDFSLAPGSDELALPNETDILIPVDAGRVLLRAARDMQEYLSVSLGICARVLMVEDVSLALPQRRGCIAFTVKRWSQVDLMEGDVPNGYRIDCADNVVITGYDERGAMRGGFYLEDVMNMRQGPYVPRGMVSRHPLFSPRMVHSGYGLDNYPDQHIAAIAHAGMDAILVFVKSVDTTPYGYLDFNELCWRAAEYGVDVYAYSYLKSDMHPDDPEAAAYYDKLYGSIFQCCPAFKGIVLVGESVEFPSKDERTTGKSYLVPTADGLPSEKPSPGWWPCRDYPQWLTLVKNAVRHYKQDADIVFWTYNWGYVEEKYRVELINNLPTDISLLVTFEMFEKIKTGEVTSTCVDYTLMFEGPGAYFLSEAKAAKQKGIRLYAMVNTGGLTWDVGVVPYEPAPQQWMRRHKAILDMREQYGLCGLMESHHYGFWPSFVSDLAKWTFTSGSPAPLEVLKGLAARDFGAENADKVVEAWNLWSDGIRHYMSTNEDQYGPFRIGPAYPLVLSHNVTVPETPFAMFGNRIFNTMYGNADSGRCSLLSFRLPVEIEYLTVMCDNFQQGAELIRSILPSLNGWKREDGERMANLGQFMSNCARTTINVKMWYQYKLKLWSSTVNGEVEDTVEAMAVLADAEIANAGATIPLVQMDSRLGWEPSMEYMCDEAHLRWKIKQVGLAKNELEMYRKALQYNS
jgi:hypothetical protein